jgi:putative redox protein
MEGSTTMGTIALTWVGQKRFLGVDSSGVHSVVLSPPSDIGIKPSDGLLIALASCSAYDVVGIIEKRRLELERLEVSVEATQADEAPWAFQRIHLRFTAGAAGLTVEQLERAIDLSMNKYCSVRASLAPSVEVTYEAHVAAGEQ